MMEKQLTDDDIARALGRRLKGLRRKAGLTLEALAEQAGISRAMISRIERGESSPTAVLLGRLCAGLGVSLASLFARETPVASPLQRAGDQPVWQDPETGYVRRAVSPSGTGSPVEIVDVTLPPGARVAFDHPWLSRGIDQHVWVLDGTLEKTIGDEVFLLHAGDCLHMRLDRPNVYHNPGTRPVRYAVVLAPIDERKG
ncbi:MULTISPECIES: helix-turn-helix domain-containing protein [Chelatococcus]|nr:MULTISPECIES: XRE family transcriptional regulator [Chelatococcus]